MMNSFQNELQDLITAWLAKGDDPSSMRTVMLDLCGDLKSMAELKRQMSSGTATDNQAGDNSPSGQ